ncbi:hypothetical protein F4703DRAFT_1865404 [Phycomyces blakesleeanus]
METYSVQLEILERRIPQLEKEEVKEVFAILFYIILFSFHSIPFLLDFSTLLYFTSLPFSISLFIFHC